MVISQSFVLFCFFFGGGSVFVSLSEKIPRTSHVLTPRHYLESTNAFYFIQINLFVKSSIHKVNVIIVLYQFEVSLEISVASFNVVQMF